MEASDAAISKIGMRDCSCDGDCRVARTTQIFVCYHPAHRVDPRPICRTALDGPLQIARPWLLREPGPQPTEQLHHE